MCSFVTGSSSYEIVCHFEQRRTTWKESGKNRTRKVSLILPNLVQTVVAIYTTLRTGAIVVLHNPRNDEMQMEHQLKAAGSEMVICLDVLVPRTINLRKRTNVNKIMRSGATASGISRYNA